MIVSFICKRICVHVCTYPLVLSTIYLQQSEMWRCNYTKSEGPERCRDRERKRKSWTERGVRSLLETTLALGRVITRFVSRKPSGSTQMRAGSSYRECRTFVLVTALFSQQTDDFSLFLFICLQRILSLAIVCFTTFQS